MTSKFKIKRIKVPYAALCQLTAEERYALFMLGHVFNEIMALNKMVVMAQFKKKKNRPNAIKAGGCFNGLFFLRLLAGKLYEASLVLRNKDITTFLKGHCFPHLKFDGVATLKAFNQKTTKCKWLSAARNGHSMHYPSLEHASLALEGLNKGKAGFEFFVGDRHGETLYWSSDVMAGVGFAFEVDRDNYGTGIDQIFTDLNEISRLLFDLTAESINAFVLHHWRSKKKYADAVKVRDVSAFEMPDVSDFELPYFIAIENKVGDAD